MLEIQHLDWDHPPTFVHGVPASGSGHVLPDYEDFESEEDPPADVYGTSDLLPTFEGRTQTESDIENWPSNEKDMFTDDIAASFSAETLKQEYSVIEEDEPAPDDLAGSFSAETLTQEYSVIEEDEQERDDLGESFDAYTVSRNTSVDPHQFIVEEVFTDYEVDPRATSIDVATVDDELERDPLDPDLPPVDAALVNVASQKDELDADSQGQDVLELGVENPSTAAVEEMSDTVTPVQVQDSVSRDLSPRENLINQAQDSVALLQDPADPSLGKEPGNAGQDPPPLHEEASAASADAPLEEKVDVQVAAQPNGDHGSPLPNHIPMPVSADPTVHDPYEDSTTVPTLPTSFDPRAAHPIPLPASLLKAMHVHYESGLFTPPSEISSSAPTPPTAQADSEPAIIPDTYFFEAEEAAENDSQIISDVYVSYSLQEGSTDLHASVDRRR